MLVFFLQQPEPNSLSSIGAAFDIMDDPLRCPLDVALSSTDAEAAQPGLKVILDGNANAAAVSKILVRMKPVPSVDLFDIKPTLASKKSVAVKKFLTPFQRFQVCCR